MAKIKAADKNGRKNLVAKKAAGLFRKKGYPNASMRELAELLNIEAPSLYNHFASKGDILEMICSRVAAGYLDNLEKIIINMPSAAEKMEGLIRYHIRIMITEFDEQYVASHEWKHLPPSSFRVFQQERKNYEKKLISIVEAGIKKGEFITTEPRVAVLTVLSAVRGLEAWHRNKKNIPASVLEESMTKILLKGLTN